MAIEVLQSQAANKAAREEMRRRNIDCTSSIFLRIARKTGMIRGISVGEQWKSWDVLNTVLFIKDHLPPDAPILDIGAYASEVLCSLHRQGYTRLTGVDLNPNLDRMPYGDKITYVVGDFMQTPFNDSSFSAVTAISVIEHGFQSRRLLAELRRIIRPGGYFIASMDYWPNKIDTQGIQIFGMDWMIFSQDDLRRFIDEAKQFDFEPCGPLNFDASESIVKYRGKQYTFAWFVFRKSA